MKHARLVILGWSLLMVCGIWLTATTVSVHNELGDLLPEGSTASQRLLLSQVRTGLAGRLILLAIEGDNQNELASVSKALGDSLRSSNLFNFIGNGIQTSSEGEQALLFRARYLLSRRVEANTFSTDALRAALEQRLDDLRSPLAPLVKESIPADPTGEFLSILQSWSAWNAPTKYRGVWMSADRTRALLVAETKAAGFDADAQEVIQQEIRDSFGRLVEGETQPVRLLMSGPGVFAVEIQRTIEAEAWRLSIVGSTLVLFFLYASYRSFLLVLLSLIPISSGILAGMVTVNGWFGFIHGITLGFGITLLGVVVDYPIHLFSHLTAQDSAYAAMKAIWPTVRLGAFSTAIGFAALLCAGFPALAQLGLFAVAALLTAAAVTRWVLPVFLPAGFASRTVGPELLKVIAFVAKGAVLAPIAAILATMVLIWSDTPLWQQDLASVSPLSEDKKQLDQRLRQELGAPDVRDLVVIEGTTAEELLQRAETIAPKLENLLGRDILGGYDIISRYLPSRRSQEERLRALPSRAVLQENLAKAQKDLPFAPGLFDPFVEAIEAARTQPLLDRRAFEGTMLGLKLESLMVLQQDQWVAVVPLRGVVDRTQLAAIVEQWRDATVRYVDLREESNQLMAAYRDRTVQLLGWGTGAIAVALFIGLRSLNLVVRVLAPIMCSLVVVAAVLRGSGEPLSLFHVATFLLVVGLGLDYALFLNRQDETEEERIRTNFGLLVCSMTTILVFGVLAFSKIPVLHAIGMTAACGAVSCLVFAGLMARKDLHVA